MTVISILAVAWDMGTGWHGWSVDFILPILCTVSIGMMVVMARFLHLQLREYVIYMLMEIVYGLVVGILLLTHVI